MVSLKQLRPVSACLRSIDVLARRCQLLIETRFHLWLWQDAADFVELNRSLLQKSQYRVCSFFAQQRFRLQGQVPMNFLLRRNLASTCHFSSLIGPV